MLTNYFVLFKKKQGLGRVALISAVLSSTLSIHLLCLVFLFAELSGMLPPTLLDNVSEARIRLILQWILFVITLCAFHLGEFFVTAIFNPTVVDSSSFVVNHSKAYTTAMLVSFIILKFLNFHFPQLSIYKIQKTKSKKLFDDNK